MTEAPVSTYTQTMPGHQKAISAARGFKIQVRGCTSRRPEVAFVRVQSCAKILPRTFLGLSLREHLLRMQQSRVWTSAAVPPNELQLYAFVCTTLVLAPTRRAERTAATCFGPGSMHCSSMP